ncbi:MAG: DUF3795 domain-containing protein [Candidatus Thorarchaeota archaeon]|jgi:hypothetical protein
MKSRIVAPCGIVCTECQAYLATQSNDLEKLQEVAKQWSSEDQQYEAKDLMCDGCFSDRVHAFCAECETRECAIQKGYRVCSICSMYPCDRLNDVWSSFTTSSIDDCRIALENEKERILSQSRV